MSKSANLAATAVHARTYAELTRHADTMPNPNPTSVSKVKPRVGHSIKYRLVVGGPFEMMMQWDEHREAN